MRLIIKVRSFDPGAESVDGWHFIVLPEVKNVSFYPDPNEPPCWRIGLADGQLVTDRAGALDVLVALGADVGDIEDLEARALEQ